MTLYKSLGTLVLCVCVCVQVLHADSRVDFRATPPVFTSLHPENVTVYCGLNKTSASHTLVGRDVTLVDRDVTAVVRDVAGEGYTSEEVNVISGITIVRKTGETVASIGGHNKARHFFVSSPASVSGDITSTSTGNTGVQGYLQVVMRDASTQLATGEFECGVNVMTSSGRGMTLISSVKVNVQVPTLQDVISRLVQLDHDKTVEIRKLTEDKDAEMTSLRTELTQNISSQSQELKQQELEIFNLTQIADHQHQELAHQTQDISNLTQALHLRDQELSQQHEDISNLTQELSRQDQELLQQNQNISALTQQLAAQSKDTVDQKHELTQQANALSKLAHDVSALQQEDSHLRSLINQVNHTSVHENQLIQQSLNNFQHTVTQDIQELHHFETGYIRISHFRPLSNSHYTTVTRAFRKDFEQKPVVHLSVTDVQGSHPHTDQWYSVVVYSTRPHEFTIWVTILEGSQVDHITVSYLAVPNVY